MTKQEYEDKLVKTINSFSFSKLRTALDCAKFFELYYILDIKPVSESPALAKGNKLHEFYYKLSDSSTSEEESKKVLKEFTSTFPLEYLKYEKRWITHSNSLPKGPNIFFEKELTTRVPANIGFLLQKAHVDSSTQKYLDSIYFKGYVDYINMNDPNLTYIIDYKSGKASSDPKYTDQLAMYALLVFSNYPTVKKIQAYTYDISSSMNSEVSKENRVVFERSIDLTELTDTLTKVVEAVIALSLSKKFIPTPCMRCSFCPDYACQFNRVRADKKTAVPKVIEEINQSRELDTYSSGHSNNVCSECHVDDGCHSSNCSIYLAEQREIENNINKPKGIIADISGGVTKTSIEKTSHEEIMETGTLSPIGEREKNILLELKKKVSKRR